jgi:hypothetical protein
MLYHEQSNRRNSFSRIEDKKIKNFGEAISVDTDVLQYRFNLLKVVWTLFDMVRIGFGLLD